MAFADHYLSKYSNYEPFIEQIPAADLNGIVVIPAFNEPDITAALKSLYACRTPDKSYEILVVVNSGVRHTNVVLEQNCQTIKQIEDFRGEFQKENFPIHYIEIKDIPHKFAGVGTARKTGFDEAVARFNQLDKSNGLLISFDADSTVSENYLIEIELFFEQHKNLNGCSIHYEHPMSGADFPEENYQQVVQYELHLRYMNQMLRRMSYPYAFQTIGSAFVVPAHAYIRQNGMNRRKAGEDFYFLQKIIALENFRDLKNCTVFPSPRESDRVPFGTGAAMRKQLQTGLDYYPTYCPDSYLPLQSFFAQLGHIYQNPNQLQSIYDLLDEKVRDYMPFPEFFTQIEAIRKHTRDLPGFLKRFYQWFNSFKIIKYLNFVHEKYYERMPVVKAAQVLTSKNNANDLLLAYRKMEMQQNYEVRYVIPNQI